MTDIADKITEILKQSGLKGKALKDVLREVVGQAWPSLPVWSTLAQPLIEEVQKVSVGSGAVLTFEEGGIDYVVLAVAGDHYKKPAQAVMPTLYTIPGGFINLTDTTGSSLVPPSTVPEDPAVGAAREIEEELKNIDGSPLLRVDPKRLQPLETRTLAFPSGDRCLAIGSMMGLAPDEVRVIKDHVARIAVDPAYKTAAAIQSLNPESGLPEVGSVEIVKLTDLVAGKYRLLHDDQQTLFTAAEKTLNAARIQATFARTGPTRAYQTKVKTLDELTELVKTWRDQGATDIGVTSGVFDIVHPGHVSFCEDANRLCSRLVVIIASDRTVREQKGAEKPYITELKRAQTIAALDTVDAVIISDEFYHQTILAALRPEIMFKGSDYEGKSIIGANMVGKVVLIPCAEKEFYSSSAFVRKIKGSGPDTPSP